ncbi:hypothetical protein LN458_19145 [Xanthomonas arboricola]|uniref:hypothetical protein n=1 Tax=Xanthomonas TaxID=338 RepID=UPI001E39502F|nr:MULTISPECIES: hypothetical protein [Xanthomonas]MCC8443926.1 hypothetical protein [Xanthomonas cannabis]MCC8476100.1 hypothetical protein [Xanthomonas arboricola]
MPSAIPYRSDTVLSAATLSATLIWTAVLLAVFVAVLLWLKKKGLIARWLGAAQLSVTAGAIVKRAEYRLSRSTVVHLLEIDGEKVVVAESKGQVSIQRLGSETGAST